MLTELGDPARRLTFAFAESKTKFTATLVVATLLQMRAPTGKNRGPLGGLLLSSPTTFQVRGVIVKVGTAKSGRARTAEAVRARSRTDREQRRETDIERILTFRNGGGRNCWTARILSAERQELAMDVCA